MKKITINDVAKTAQVSKTTVSHYLNERYKNMSPDTRERISLAINDLNYNPNVIAKSLKNKKTMTIGIIVANILHSFSTQVIRAIEDYAHGENYHVIVCNADNDPVKEKDYIQMLLAKQVDGLVIIPTSDNDELFSKLVADDYPVVFVDRFIEGISIPSFLLDNENAIQTAFNHLLDKGYEEIGFVSQPIEDISARIERQNAYMDLCFRHKMEPFTTSGGLALIHQSLDEAIKKDALPKSLIVANDLALFEVLKLVKKHGLNIPEDLSLISIDDIEFAEFFNPGITVVAQPSFSIGEQAAQTLFEIINKKEYEIKIHRFKPELIERDSVIEYESK
ncbi:LacI family DNA-binding transcriptional regulator [Salinicoccus sp. HZC-1]|uniref:LacI family DNA-binding transcriptional regulator n=1 Tax=Salinicoccus sp. HZC-1 TaxID=3385497 RepID=UPI00398AB6C9